MDHEQRVNPYIAGAPVTGTEMFFGRDDVFSFIQRNLVGRHRDTPIVLYGQRRTGKTSVLYQVHRRLGPGYRCVLIDLHGLSLGSMGDLMLGIASTISRVLHSDHRITVDLPDRSLFLADPRSAFEDVFLSGVLSVLGEDHLVLMLDEVVRLDEEIKLGRLNREVFDYFRHLMQHHPRLNFIFSLGSGLEEMRKDYAFMFSVSLYHRISFLEPDAAGQLITEPVREHFEVAPQAVAKILEITSGHAYYTQLVCHGLFDLWMRSPKPEMTAADVHTVLADAIELGSANLTYVWEDSAPEERALMAGMAAAMRSGAREVTVAQVRNVWRKAGVTLPVHQITAALRSLDSREVVAGEHAWKFSVDLQRVWLDKHRRLDWVKDELADAIKEWQRGARAARRNRYLAATAAVVAIAGYLATGAFLGWPPWTAAPTPSPSATPSHAPGVTPLIHLLPQDIADPTTQCTTIKKPDWTSPGLVSALSCTDPNVPRGSVSAFQLDNLKDYNTTWENFNAWSSFDVGTAGTSCPPASNGTQGITAWNSKAGFPSMQDQVLECWTGSNATPIYVWTLPTQDAFILAVGADGSTFKALNNWWTSTNSSPANTPPTPSPQSSS
jgi:hypothetical protein